MSIREREEADECRREHDEHVAKGGQWCAFCENEADCEIRHLKQVDPPLGEWTLDFITPVCTACAIVYRSGQASPDADVVEREEGTLP